MESAPLAPDEAARQRALEELQLLDTPAEQEFDDITLLARALNVEGRAGPANATFINAMPQTEAEERRTFSDNGITLLCCKNSGGPASFAKIAAARELAIPVWMLRRHHPEGDLPVMGGGAEKQVANYQIHETVESVVLAARRLAGEVAAGKR